MLLRNFACLLIMAGIVEAVTVYESSAQLPASTTTQTPVPADGEKDRKQQAIKILANMAMTMQSLNSFQCELTSRFDVDAENQPIHKQTVYDVAVRRPGFLSMKIKPGQPDASVIIDGKSIWIDLAEEKKYAQLPYVPLNQLVESPLMQRGGPEAILAQLLARQPMMQLLQESIDITLGEQQEVNGVLCDHLILIQPQARKELWIETGEGGTLRKILYDFTELYAEIEKGNDTITSAHASVEIDKWQGNIEIPDERFVYDPPEEAAALGNPFAPPNPMELLNKPAPDYTADLLNGGKADAAADKGDKIVILDFWATHCPPCIAAMPVLQKVSREYAARGVVLYAINIDEPREVVERFVKKSNLDINIAIDSTNDISSRYKVFPIPQTVIIDRQGIVRKIHIGGQLNLEGVLKQDLDQILAEE